MFVFKLAHGVDHADLYLGILAWKNEDLKTELDARTNRNDCDWSREEDQTKGWKRWS